MWCCHRRGESREIERRSRDKFNLQETLSLSLFEGADVASKDPERETAIIDKWLFPRHLSVVSADECLLESLDLREEDSNRVIPGTLMEIKAKTELEEREAV